MACSEYGSDVTWEGSYSASSIYSGSYPASNAYDDVLSNYWICGSGQNEPSWNQVDFGSGNEKQIEKLRIYLESSSLEQYLPRDFQLLGSNTGSFSGEEDVLLDVTGATYTVFSWSEWEFENSTSYRYYRIYITDVDQASLAILIEVEMMECTVYATTTTMSTTSSSTSSTASTTSTQSTTSSSASTTSTQSTTSSTGTTYTGYTYPTTTTTTTSTTTSTSTSSTASSTNTSSSTSSTASTLSTSSTQSTTSSSSTTSTTSTSSTTTSSSSSTTTTTAPNTSFCVFRDVAIPEQSLITKANIYLTANKTDIPTPVFTHVYFSQEDNPSPPTDKEDLDARPRNAYVPWTIQAPWYDNVTYKSPDLTVPLQEIVDRSGFVEGNNVMAMIEHLWDTSIPSYWYYITFATSRYNLWWVGSYSNGGYLGWQNHAWTKFADCTIPQGATITSCVFRLKSENATPQTEPLSVRLSFYKADNAPNSGGAILTFAAEDDENLRTSGVTWLITDTWYDGGFYNTPDLSAELQQIVDRSGWSSGNNLAIFSHNLYTQDQWPTQPTVWTKTRWTGFGSGDEFRLDVTWTTGSGFYYTEIIGGRSSAQNYDARYGLYDTSQVEAQRFWSAIEHQGGIEKACLRAHWRAAERIQTPLITPTESFQLDVGFFCTISTYPTDANIYYTTNGDDPNEGDTLYTAPFVINSPQTIKARAYKQYWIPSYIAEQAYTILWPGVGESIPLTGEAGGTRHVARFVNDKTYLLATSWTTYEGNDQKGPTVYMYDPATDTYSEECIRQGGDTFPSSYMIDLYVEDDGTLHVAYAERWVADFNRYDVYYATNASGSWVDTKMDDQEWANYPGFLALDSSGYVHLFHQIRGGTRQNLRHITNQSGSWQSEVVVNDVNIGYARGVIHNDNSFTITCEFEYGEYPFYPHIAEGSWGSWTTQTMPTGIGNCSFWHHVVKEALTDEARIITFNSLTDTIYETVKVAGVWTSSLWDTVDPDYSATSLYAVTLDANNAYHMTIVNQGGYDTGIYYITNESGSIRYYFTKSEIAFEEGQQASYGDVGFNTSTKLAWITYRIAPVQPPVTYYTHRVDLGSNPSYTWFNQKSYASLDDGTWLEADIGSDAFWTVPTNANSFGIYFNAGDTLTSHTFLRFQDIDIPKGTTILSAYIGYQVAFAGLGSTFAVEVFGNDVDDAVAPTSQAQYEALVRTTDSAIWSISNPTDMYIGEVIWSSDIKDVVQEIVNRSGWVAENAMQFMIEPYSGDHVSGAFFGGASFENRGYTWGPILIIRY